MPLVLFSHANPSSPSTAAEADLRRLAESARHAGARVVHLPWRREDVSFADALSRLPVQRSAFGMLSGYLIGLGRYTELEQAAAGKGVRMLNTASESQRAMLFDRFYPLLEGLTARSVIVEHPDDLRGRRTSSGSRCSARARLSRARRTAWRRAWRATPLSWPSGSPS